MKKFLVASMVFSCAFAIVTKAQHKPAQIHWPVPKNVPGLLFYIQRDPDINTVCYTINKLADGSVNPKEPVNIFWIKYATDSKIKKLNALQREFGYGLSFVAAGADSFLLQSVAFPSKKMYLNKSRYGKYVVYIDLNGKRCVLNRVYIRITGGTAISPDVAYIEFFGKDANSHQQVTERLDLN